MVGQNIGKYRVLERVGRGGMGTVYRAVDETLHREVAIKVLNAELNDPEVAKRFRAEAITVARLSHPGIATIYELFQHEGQWLMVMEFVRGETLEGMVSRLGALSPERAAELCMQSLAALAHAHSMGVVHRDLKPANIMVTESGTVKIMDFGIARVAGTEHLTNAGFMMGTPAYMAPEQVLGHEIDARADIYAMGVVFYRLVTAQLPFKGETPFAMAQAQVNNPPTPISTFRPDLPPWVEEVMGRSLAKKPDDRFPSAVDFHESLSRCLSGQPMSSSYHSLAPTGLIMTPPHPMPTGSIERTMLATPSGSGAVPVSVVSVPVPVDPAASAPTMGGTPVATERPPTGAFAGPGADTIRTPGTGSMPTPGTGAVPASGTGAMPSPGTGAVAAAPGTGAAPSAPGTGALAAAGSGAVPVGGGASGAVPVTVPQTASTAPVPKKGSSAGLVAAAAVVVVLGAGAFFWMRARQHQAPPEPAPAPVAEAAPAETPQTPASSEATPAPVATASMSPASSAAPSKPVASGAPSATAASAASTPASRGAIPADAPPADATARRGGAPAANARATGAGRAAVPIDDSHLAFTDIKLYTVTGKKTKDDDVLLSFGGGQVSVLAKKDSSVVVSWPYKNVAHATYIKARDPKWDASLASPPDGLDVGGAFRTSKHWFVIQNKDEFLVLRLADSNYSRTIEVIEARTGIKVTQLTSDSDKK